MSTAVTPSAIGPVKINDREVNLTVVRCGVGRHEGEHDTATLGVYSATATRDFDLLPDQRIEFTFGNFGAQGLFQGYVQSVSPMRRIVNGQQSVEQEIACLGASMVMKGNRPRFFTDMTCTEMLRRIVTENGLGFSDEYRNDTNKWRTLAQTSETDWEMIVLLADRLGARVVYDRGVIRLINYLDVSYRELPTRTYVANADISNLDRTNDQRGYVVEYVPTNMSFRDPSYRSPTLSYLSDRQAVMLHPPMPSATSQPWAARKSHNVSLVSRFATEYPALSVQEAEAYQSGFYTPAWNQEGEIRVTGDAQMMPAMVVQVSSSGRTPVLQANFDGVWYVKGVRHSLGLQGRFFTTLDMGRSQARGGNWYAPRPFWMGTAAKRTVPTLRSSGAGQWISNWRAA